VSEADDAPVWTAQPGWVWTTSTPHDGRLYTGTVDGKILALSTEDGRTLWMLPTNGRIYPGPAQPEPKGIPVVAQAHERAAFDRTIRQANQGGFRML
jgi:outer membrane protein assembly factor BamB